MTDNLIATARRALDALERTLTETKDPWHAYSAAKAEIVGIDASAYHHLALAFADIAEIECARRGRYLGAVQ